MGVEKVSKKDPRVIYERTRNLKTGTYYTITRPNPEYKGMTLKQAKAMERIKELKLIRGQSNISVAKIDAMIKEQAKIAGIEYKPPTPQEEKEAERFAIIFTCVILIIGLIFIVIVWNGIKNWWNNSPSWGDYGSGKSIAEKESDCHAKGMYPVRVGENCDSGGINCSVSCMPYPQKKIDD